MPWLLSPPENGMNSVLPAKVRSRARSKSDHARLLLLRDPKELDRSHLELNSVQEVQDFWRVARRVTHAAMPLDFICLCLRPFALMHSTVFRERAPFESDEEFRLFQELSPLNAFLASHPGTRIVRLSDIISSEELTGSGFFRQFMRPYGERYFACFCFWHSGTFQGMIGLHRTSEQGDFTDAEIEFLARLHGQFDMVVQRILSLHRERAVRLSLEKLLGNIPIATLLLDWELKVTYRNRSAIELCGLWNLGQEAARTWNCTEDFRVPPEVLEYCAEFKARWNPCHHRESPMISVGGAWISHSGIPGLRATVNLLQLDAAPLSMPVFMIRIEQLTLDGHREHPSRESLPQFARLSPREREVATLAAQGCGNDEIAHRLHKSVLTVKKQMRSIYTKLGISTRGRLIAILR